MKIVRGTKTITVSVLRLAGLFKCRHVRKAVVVAALIIAFVFSPFLVRHSIAATSEAKTQQPQNPTVIFENGLLTVEAKDVKLKALRMPSGRKRVWAGFVTLISWPLTQKGQMFSTP